MKILALLASGFEDLEAFGTIALLRRAEIEVDICSVENKTQMISKYGVRVEADVLINQICSPDYDVLFLPGGNPGVENLFEVEKVKLLVEYFMKSDKIVACICAAPSILGRLGLLGDKIYTCFPGYEKLCVNGNYQDASVQVDGNLITGRAVGNIFEFTQALITKLKGKEFSQIIMDSIYFGK